MTDLTPIDRPIRKWTRNYAYGWCRVNDHDTLAWFFAGKQGRASLKTLRQIKRMQREEPAVSPGVLVDEEGGCDE